MVSNLKIVEILSSDNGATGKKVEILSSDHGATGKKVDGLSFKQFFVKVTPTLHCWLVAWARGRAATLALIFSF